MDIRTAVDKLLTEDLRTDIQKEIAKDNLHNKNIGNYDLISLKDKATELIDKLNRWKHSLNHNDTINKDIDEIVKKFHDGVEILNQITRG